ncbi:MAG: KamA family radical SAM protein [Desulfohalobiaceae bacterium]
MNKDINITELDGFSQELFQELLRPAEKKAEPQDQEQQKAEDLLQKAQQEDLTQPIVDLFQVLLELRRKKGLTPLDLGLQEKELLQLAIKHQELDEHLVSIGGRVLKALPIVQEADQRMAEYLQKHPEQAPSGIELWDRIQENQERIKKVLGMQDQDWSSFTGQMQFAIESVQTLSKILDLPQKAVQDIQRVTKQYRMRLTPYYSSLIMPGVVNDPVLLQSVPTGEMVDNVGEEIPPVAADHSPARLIDQFYPRVATIKATNMCGMYCTHCLRIAHIGKKDRIYSKKAYQEALDYIRRNTSIRDVLVTGGDAFVLPNSLLRWLLQELDAIEHVRLKRLGSRIPVTTPQRMDSELLDILEESNDKKPLRVVTQINTAQEITPISRQTFGMISKRVSAVLNQAVLLRGINDTRTKMWKLCETIQEAHVRPYYVFNCSYRNPQFAHLRVPVEVGRDIIESMYGNISGDAIPRFIATAGGKIPLHRSNVQGWEGSELILKKPWNQEEVRYPDASREEHAREDFSFARYGEGGY